MSSGIHVDETLRIETHFEPSSASISIDGCRSLALLRPRRPPPTALLIDISVIERPLVLITFMSSVTERPLPDLDPLRPRMGEGLALLLLATEPASSRPEPLSELLPGLSGSSPTPPPMPPPPPSALKDCFDARWRSCCLSAPAALSGVSCTVFFDAEGRRPDVATCAEGRRLAALSPAGVFEPGVCEAGEPPDR